MNLIPPEFDPQGILDPSSRAVMADWWEEQRDDERANLLRIGKVFCLLKGGPWNDQVVECDRAWVVGFGFRIPEERRPIVRIGSGLVPFQTGRTGLYRAMRREHVVWPKVYNPREPLEIVSKLSVDREGNLALEWQGWD